MINPFVLKKYAAILVPALLTTTLFYIGITFYKNIFYGIGFMLIGIIISVVISTLMLKNPYTSMLEGKGLMMFDINSTGIIQPYIMRLALPFIKGSKDGKNIKDTFDREKLLTHAPPIVCKHTIAELNKEGGITIDKSLLDLDREQLNKSRFAFFHFPVIMYNSALGSVVDKNILSQNEQEGFIDHLAFHLLTSLEEGTEILRNLTRYVAEQLQPQKNFLQQGWVKILVIVVVIALIAVLAYYGAPMFSKAFSSGAEAIGGAATSAGGAVGVR